MGTNDDERPRIGRPRNFDAATERGMILDAALRVMAANGYVDASVGDVLAEAGLSTRAFYRHFDTKAALILTLFRRDAEAVGRTVSDAVAAAPGPLEGLDAWLEGFLDLFFVPRRAARAALFTSPAVRAAEGYEDEVRRSHDLLAAPLVGVLRAGHRRRLLRSTKPERDARTILTAGGIVSSPDVAFADRKDARAHIMRFCWPALGLDPTPPSRKQ